MKVDLSSLGRFHMYHLARELDRRDMLNRIYTGYPMWKLKGSGIRPEKIRTFPWLVGPRMALAGRLNLPVDFVMEWDNVAQKVHDRWVESSIADCDIFHGMGRYNIRSGTRAKNIGAKYVCDVGSAHVLETMEILEAEQERVGIFGHRIHPEGVERELAEYETSDKIFLMSSFAKRSFTSRGISEDQLVVIPPGADLSRFTPRQHSLARQTFRVLFVGHVGVQKGAHILASAFKKAALPDSELIFVGSADERMVQHIQALALTNIKFVGHVPNNLLPEYYQRATVFVLPSFQDGFGMVALEAMASGCVPVISRNAGAADVIDEGVDGYVFDAGDTDTLADHLTRLHADRELTEQMSERATAKAKQDYSWTRYAEGVHRAYDLMRAPGAREQSR